VVGSGTVYHVTRDNYVGTASSYCSKEYPCSRVLTKVMFSSLPKLPHFI
jgi:hypothetical protein